LPGIGLTGGARRRVGISESSGGVAWLINRTSNRPIFTASPSSIISASGSSRRDFGAFGARLGMAVGLCSPVRQ
jgi:hypothetical protein